MTTSPTHHWLGITLAGRGAHFARSMGATANWDGRTAGIDPGLGRYGDSRRLGL